MQRAGRRNPDPGEGQVRALISVGGNPVVGFPDQAKMARALDDLELFVQIDPWMSASAKRATVVLAPSQCLEREDITNLSEWWHEEPYARYTEAVVEAPGDCIDEYEMFWTLAHHLGITMQLMGGPLPMDRKPTKQEFLDLMVAGSLMKPSDVRRDVQANGGAAVIYPDSPQVEPLDESEFHRFNLAEGSMPAEIGKYAASDAAREGFDFRLISRRSKPGSIRSAIRSRNCRKRPPPTRPISTRMTSPRWGWRKAGWSRSLRPTPPSTAW